MTSSASPLRFPWLGAAGLLLSSRGTLTAVVFLVLPLLVPPAVALYRRLRHSHVAASRERRRILDLLRERPGATVAELAKALAPDYRTVLHHVRVLCEFGHVQSLRRGRRKHLLVSGTVPSWLAEDAVIATRHENRRILLALHARCPIGQQELADRLGITRSAVSRRLALLRSRGLVEALQEDGRRTVYRLSGKATRMIRWT